MKYFEKFQKPQTNDYNPKYPQLRRIGLKIRGNSWWWYLWKIKNWNKNEWMNRNNYPQEWNSQNTVVTFLDALNESKMNDPRVEAMFKRSRRSKISFVNQSRFLRAFKKRLLELTVTSTIFSDKTISEMLNCSIKTMHQRIWHLMNIIQSFLPVEVEIISLELLLWQKTNTQVVIVWGKFHIHSRYEIFYFFEWGWKISICSSSEKLSI